jgi:hypothetical protein
VNKFNAVRMPPFGPRLYLSNTTNAPQISIVSFVQQQQIHKSAGAEKGRNTIFTDSIEHNISLMLVVYSITPSGREDHKDDDYPGGQEKNSAEN